MPQARESAPIPSLGEAVGYFRRLLVLLRPYWGSLAKSVMLGLFLGLFALITPYLSKLLFDEVYPGATCGCCTSWWRQRSA